MKRTCLFLLFSLCMIGTAQAQVYTTASTLRWDAPSNSVDAMDAASFMYRIFINGASVPVVMSGVTCGPPITPDLTFTCTAPVLAVMLPGLNRRRTVSYITAEDTTTPVSGQSDPSNNWVVNRRPNQASGYRVQ